MTNQNIWALLVNDDEPSFTYGPQKFVQYLRDELHVPASRIEIITGTCGMLERSRSFLRRFTRENNIGKLVMVHSGYPLSESGASAGLLGTLTRAPSEEEVAEFADAFPTYQEWGSTIKHALGEQGEFIFISAASYSGRAIKAFKEIGLIPCKGLVLTACREDEEHNYPYFLEEIIEHYQHKQPFIKAEIPPLMEKRTRVLLKPSKHRESLYSRARSSLQRAIYGVETQVIENLDLMERHIRLAPVMISPAQHPMRYGKDLDYLLFPS